MTAQTDPQGNAGVPAGLDQQESREWMDALSAVIDREGAEYAHKLIEDLLECPTAINITASRRKIMN